MTWWITVALVTGTVTSEGTGAPVPGARVSVQASDVETTAATDGTFELDVDGADLVVVAAAKGWFTASLVVASTPASGVSLVLEPVPDDDNPDYQLKTPSACGICHEDQVAEWEDTPMARAGRNTWVHDIYSGTGTSGGDGGFVYLRDSPHAATNPVSECASCHEPEVWVGTPYTPLGDLSAPTPAMMHGVSCDLCHKIASVDDSKPNYPGIYPGSVTVSRPSTDPAWTVMYGVLGDVDYYSEGRMRASYQPQLTAAACGLCHQDKNDPDGDGLFEEADGVISEPTYLEWLASPYADVESEHYATCVDCHMPPTDRSAACSALETPLSRPPGEVRSHRILGTTAEYLDNAVTMAMTAEVAADGNSIDVTVAVTNDRTGHHVPTGVTIRNVILVIDAWREQDGTALEHTGAQTVHELGGVGDPAAGNYAGVPGKLYAKVNHGPDGAGPVFFTDATGIQFDTRIPALSTDDTAYTFRIPDGGGELHLRARLIYRRSWRALVEAKGWTEDGHGNPLEDVAPPHFGHLMAQVEQTIDLPDQPSAPDAGPGGIDDGGGGGCGCRVTHRRAGASAWLWLAIATLALRRRRH